METSRLSGNRDEKNAHAPNPLIARIQGEYTEMPGLRLNLAQACRLWQVDVATCRTLLEELVREKVLYRTHEGFYVASSVGRRPFMSPLPRRAPVPHSA